MSIRVRLESWILKKLKAKYTQKVYQEHGIILTNSQLVYIALLEFEAYQNNEEVEINFKKNGKINFKFK